MKKISSFWEIHRDPRSIIGFLSNNRPSTDAMTALDNWCGRDSRRGYEVKVDTDDFLVVELGTYSKDIEEGNELDQECQRLGLIRKRQE